MIRRFGVLAIVVACSLTTARLIASAPFQDPAPLAVDDIVTRNIEAKGGVAKLMAVTSMKRTSTVLTMGTEMALTVYNKRPNLVRQEITHKGQLIVSGFDGQVPWVLNPLVGPPPARAVIISGQQADQIRAESGFDGPLVNYRSQGSTLALDVPEVSATRRLLHLRLTTATGQTTHIYLDPKTFLEVKQTTALPQVQLEQQFEDYRTVDGFTMPFVMRNLVNGVVQQEFKLLTVEFNPVIDEALFRLPK